MEKAIQHIPVFQMTRSVPRRRSSPRPTPAGPGGPGRGSSSCARRLSDALRRTRDLMNLRVRVTTLCCHLDPSHPSTRRRLSVSPTRSRTRPPGGDPPGWNRCGGSPDQELHDGAVERTAQAPRSTPYGLPSMPYRRMYRGSYSRSRLQRTAYAVRSTPCGLRRTVYNVRRTL
jgi:hypothetical protein